ncbi:MAG: hypothetical protein R2701_05840 [Acidimicrobiales bacterium]
MVDLAALKERIDEPGRGDRSDLLAASIHAHPELGFEEPHRAVLTDLLKRQPPGDPRRLRRADGLRGGRRSAPDRGAVRVRPCR